MVSFPIEPSISVIWSMFVPMSPSTPPEAWMVTSFAICSTSAFVPSAILLLWLMIRISAIVDTLPEGMDDIDCALCARINRPFGFFLEICGPPLGGDHLCRLIGELLYLLHFQATSFTLNPGIV